MATACPAEQDWRALAENEEEAGNSSEPPSKMMKLEVSCELCHRTPKDSRG